MLRSVPEIVTLPSYHPQVLRSVPEIVTETTEDSSNPFVTSVILALALTLAIALTPSSPQSSQP